MRLFLAAALAVLSALAFASPGSGARFQSWSTLDDGGGECKRCHANGEGTGLDELDEPAAFDLSKSDWGTTAAARRWEDVRRRLPATGRHE
jgi:hypothetical protein